MGFAERHEFILMSLKLLQLNLTYTRLGAINFQHWRSDTYTKEEENTLLNTP